MAKKLFAFLGVGNKDGKYEEIEYYFTGKPEKGYITEYIQEALAELLNEPNLQIIVFVTEKAKDVNWEPKDKIGLKIKLEKLNVNYKAVDIPDGKTNREIWQIFTKVYDEIELHDEIYVDVTHSFRSIPIIFMSVLNYAKVTKRCDIKRIFYGAFDAKENGRAPIYDLTLFNQITEWSSGVEQLLSTGECEMFCSTVEKTLRHLSEETDEVIRLISECSRLIKEFYTDLKLVRGKSVLDDGEKLYQVLCEIKALNTEKHIAMQPFFHILGRIENQVDFFKNENLIKKILECVKLCRKFGQYQQAYTFLRENIINYVCINSGLDWKKEKPDRMIAEKVMNSLNYMINIKKCCDKEINEKENDENVKHILENRIDFISNDAVKLFGALINYRNDLAHAQFRMEYLSKKKIKKKIDSFIDDFEKYYIS